MLVKKSFRDYQIQVILSSLKLNKATYLFFRLIFFNISSLSLSKHVSKKIGTQTRKSLENHLKTVTVTVLD